MAHLVEPPEPVRLLIAALGGEGGGVLAGWITQAAMASGLVASRTSIPGVAQRTGATTYYIEMMPVLVGAARPVLALNPAPGQVDVLLASELLEATRLAGQGFVAPDRTTLIASTNRVFTVDEKSLGGDGRADSERLAGILRQVARRALLADMGLAARGADAPVSAVMLGALAASGAVPIPEAALRDAIRAEGKAVARNLAGFEAGRALFAADPSAARRVNVEPVAAPSLPAPSLPAAAAGLGPSAAAIVAHGFDRLADYQDRAYAERYLARVVSLAGLTGADDALVAEFARHLAVRMSVEDVIRVAQLKLRAARIAAVTAEARARPGDIVDITEFLKPGPDELLGLLPPMLARPLLAVVARRGWGAKGLAMSVKTTRVSGYLRLKSLAALRRWRPFTQRFHDEQAWLARWIDLVERSLARDPQAAREVIACAKIVRGYGDTYERGRANFARIAGEVIVPALDGHLPRGMFADAVLQARLAAEKDPEGPSLERTLAAITARRTEPKLAAE